MTWFQIECYKSEIDDGLNCIALENGLLVSFFSGIEFEHVT